MTVWSIKELGVAGAPIVRWVIDDRIIARDVVRE